jgi:hypothetical protein
MEHSQLCIIINDIAAFVDGVEDNVRDVMNTICRLAKGLGLICIATADADRLSELSQIEPLTKTFAASQNGLLVSGSPALCSCFKNTLTYDEKKTSFTAGEAMIFDNGKTMKIRPVK